jgi:hypothetical protein
MVSIFFQGMTTDLPRLGSRAVIENSISAVRPETRVLLMPPRRPTRIRKAVRRPVAWFGYGLNWVQRSRPGVPRCICDSG